VVLSTVTRPISHEMPHYTSLGNSYLPD
jgi:hypothetical protein